MSFLSRVFKKRTHPTPQYYGLEPEIIIPEPGSALTFDNPNTFAMLLMLELAIAEAVLINHAKNDDYTITIGKVEYTATIGDTFKWENGTLVLIKE